MLAPLAESAITEPGVVRMACTALPRWQQLIASLTEPVFFQQAGTFDRLAPPRRCGRPNALRACWKPTSKPPQNCRHCKSWTALLWRKQSLRWQSASTTACICRAKASWTTASC